MPGSREEDFKRNNAFSLYDLYGHAPAQEPLPPGVIQFTTLVDYPVIIIPIYSAVLSMPRNRKEDF